MRPRRRPEVNDENDNDLMRAIAEVPPQKLQNIDEAFVVLESGLGSIFSASMARRAAMNRRSVADKRTRKTSFDTDTTEPKLRGTSLMQHAVNRLGTSVRRFNAQAITMEMFDNFADSEPKMAQRSSLSGMTLQGPRALNLFSQQIENSRDRRKSFFRSSLIEEEEEEAQASVPITALQIQRINSEEKADLTITLQNDEEFLKWAQDSLQISPTDLAAVDDSDSFKDRFSHQMVCWEAMRADKVLPVVPIAPAAPNSPRTKASFNTDSRCIVGPNLKLPMSSRLPPHGGKSQAAMDQSISEPASPLSPGSVSEFGQGDRPDSCSNTHESQRSEAVELGSTSKFGTLAAELTRTAKSCSEEANYNTRPKIRLAYEEVEEEEADSSLPKRAQLLVAARRQRKGMLLTKPSSRKRRSPDVGCSNESFFSTLDMNRGTLIEGFKNRPARSDVFKEPHSEIPTAKFNNMPEFMYLRRCELAGLVPCNAAWRHFASRGVVDVRTRSLNDADILAVVGTALECATGDQDLNVLDVSGNLLSDQGLVQISQLISTSADSVRNGLHTLKVANNRMLRWNSDAVMKEFASALVALPVLLDLDMSGVVLQSRTAMDLADALQSCLALRRLSLAGCGLGRNNQQECAAFANLLHVQEGKHPALCLESVDLAMNYFGREGFAAFGKMIKTTKIRSLSFAGNGGGRANHREIQNDRQSYKDAGVNFHPMQLLLEGLQTNGCLETLDISDCGIGPDTAFVFEDALGQHTAIKSFNVSGNPLGDEGLRCLVRLLIKLRSDMAGCNICGHRNADAWANRMRYRPSQPGGIYNLNLRYPHDRATLKTLLRIGGSFRGGTFRFFKFDPKQSKLNVEKNPDTDSWTVPHSGLHSFTFQPHISEAAKQHHNGSSNATSNPEPSNRMEPATSSGVHSQMHWKLEQMPPSGHGATGRRSNPWNNSVAMNSVNSGPNSFSPRTAPTTKSKVEDTAPKKKRFALAGAMAAAVSAANFEVAAAEQDWAEISSLLKNARVQVSALRFPLLRSMFLSLITREEQQRFVRACSKDVSFNAAQVNKLCEDRPEISNDLVSALFPNIRGRSSQLLLLGNMPCTHRSEVSKILSPCLWFQEGNLTGRYNLNLLVPADSIVAENCLLINAWESEVGKLKNRPDVSQKGNYEMLRNEEHNEVPFTYHRGWTLPSSGSLRFDYSSARRPNPAACPMPEVSEVLRYLRTPIYSTTAKLKALRAVSVHMYISTHQFRNLLCCFIDVHGRRDAFCILHTRVVDSVALLSPALLYCDTVFEDVDRQILFHRLGHLHLLSPIHPEHVLFTCNLAVYEERRVVELLVQIMINEAGGKVVKRCDDGRYIPIPASWANKGVPCEDMVIRCLYRTANTNLPYRREQASKWCVGFPVNM